jgi:hypothetical protein
MAATHRQHTWFDSKTATSSKGSSRSPQSCSKRYCPIILHRQVCCLRVLSERDFLCYRIRLVGGVAQPPRPPVRKNQTRVLQFFEQFRVPRSRSRWLAARSLAWPCTACTHEFCGLGRTTARSVVADCRAVMSHPDSFQRLASKDGKSKMAEPVLHGRRNRDGETICR